MPTWNSASDWDGATAENGVVHESVANTDHDDDTIVKQGYSAQNPFQSPNRYYPFHEDSGSTAFDLGSDDADGTISGVTLGATGLLGTSAYSFDGTDDYVSTSQFDVERNHTIIVYVQTNDATPTQQPFRGVDFGADSEYGTSISISSGSFNYVLRGANTSNPAVSGSVPNTTDLHHVAASWDGTNQILYLNGSQADSATPGITVAQGTGDTMIGASSTGGSNVMDGKIAGVWLYGGTVLSGTQISNHFDVVDTPGTLTTDYRGG